MNLSIVEQVSTAMKPNNRLSTVCGIILGGFVPLATFFIVHYEVASKPHLWTVVLGGLLFSAKTVFEWSKSAFASPAKALGFVVLVEGVMTLSGLFSLSIAALSLLMAVNGIATGCTLSLQKKASQASRRSEAKTNGKVAKMRVAA